MALGGHQSIEDLILPGGRLLEQRDVAWERLNAIPGVSCVKPRGALYAFPRLDPEVYDIHDDEQLVQDLLLQERILVTQGTGFNWPDPGPLPHRHAAVGPGPRRRDRADRQLPLELQAVAARHVRAVKAIVAERCRADARGESPCS